MAAPLTAAPSPRPCRFEFYQGSGVAQVALSWRSNEYGGNTWGTISGANFKTAK